MEEEKEENDTEEELKYDVSDEMFDINDKDKEKGCNVEIIQEIETGFIKHQHCMDLR